MMPGFASYDGTKIGYRVRPAAFTTAIGSFLRS